MKEPLKAAQLSRRGVSDSPESWGEKPRTLKPNAAPRFFRLESNFTLTDCGVRSFPVEVEELPAVRRWDVLPAHSESRRGRNMKRTFSPSLPPSIRPRSSPNPGPFSVPCVFGAGALSVLPFTHSFPLPNTKNVVADRNVSVFCVVSV